MPWLGIIAWIHGFVNDIQAMDLVEDVELG